MTWIQTFTGLAYDPLNPDPAKISIEDIAHALALKNRFGGATRVPYSVAEHSVHVSNRVSEPELQLAALLHDAAEAYLADVPTPLKWVSGFNLPSRLDALTGAPATEVRPWVTWEEIEKRNAAAVATRFGFDPALFDRAPILKADQRMLVAEARHFLAPCEINWLHSMTESYGDFLPLCDDGLRFNRTWMQAEKMFLDRFRELTGA